MSAVLTIAGQLFGQRLERQARRRELFLTKAIELARWKNERTYALASKPGNGKWYIHDEIYLARAFVDDLERLFTSGKLTPNSEQIYEREIKALREQHKE
jgi:hypothetical protein